MPAFATTTSSLPNSATALASSRLTAARSRTSTSAVSALRPGFFEITRCRQRVLVGLDVVADIEEDDVSTLLGQLDGVATTLTAGTASDQNDFSCYAARILTHHVSF